MRKIALLTSISMLAAASACDVPPEADPVHETVSAALTNCVPGDNQISVFLDWRYLGSCVTLGVNAGPFGAYPFPSSFAPMPNDNISSIRVGRNVTAILFDAAGYGQWFEEVTADKELIQLNDRVSSIRIIPNDRRCWNHDDPRQSGYAPRQGEIVLYGEEDHWGDCVVYRTSDSTGGGTAIFRNSLQMVFANDNASSVRIGPNTQGKFFRDDGLTGVSEVLSGWVPRLRSTFVGTNLITSFHFFPLIRRGGTCVVPGGC